MLDLTKEIVGHKWQLINNIFKSERNKGQKWEGHSEKVNVTI